MRFVLWGIGAATLGSLVAGLWVLFFRRVRVRVRPVRLESGRSRTSAGLGIVVRNASSFPVTINEVGYMLSGGKHAPILPAVTLEERRLPARLEPGAELTVRGDLNEADLKVLSRTQLAYAVTSCGKRATGTSLDLRRTTSFAEKLF